MQADLDGKSLITYYTINANNAYDVIANMHNNATPTMVGEVELAMAA
jgi:hypothetical protein